MQDDTLRENLVRAVVQHHIASMTSAATDDHDLATAPTLEPAHDGQVARPAAVFNNLPDVPWTKTGGDAVSLSPVQEPGHAPPAVPARTQPPAQAQTGAAGVKPPRKRQQPLPTTAAAAKPAVRRQAVDKSDGVYIFIPHDGAALERAQKLDTFVRAERSDAFGGPGTKSAFQRTVLADKLESADIGRILSSLLTAPPDRAEQLCEIPEFALLTGALARALVDPTCGADVVPRAMFTRAQEDVDRLSGTTKTKEVLRKVFDV